MLAERQIEVWKEEVFGPAVASEILLDTHRILEREKRASWLVSGGRDGEKVARAIASSPLLKGLRLSCLHVFFADERFSSDPSLLNFNRLSPFLDVLKGWGMPEENIHPFPQLGSAKEGAKAYEEEILSLGFGKGCSISWLSCGPDGHVASLFSGKSLGRGLTTWVGDSPKPPASRMSVSMEFIQSSLEVFLVAAQKEKREIVENAVRIWDDPLIPATFCQGKEKSAWRFSS
ncbi:MAG: 6-phosphogluconolactonase, partial [Aeriscardovia sp.]|nr:6-phosphogluconolactonase [Aeriscardovia sp.]